MDVVCAEQTHAHTPPNPLCWIWCSSRIYCRSSFSRYTFICLWRLRWLPVTHQRRRTTHTHRFQSLLLFFLKKFMIILYRLPSKLGAWLLLLNGIWVFEYTISRQPLHCHFRRYLSLSFSRCAENKKDTAKRKMNGSPISAIRRIAYTMMMRLLLTGGSWRAQKQCGNWDKWMARKKKGINRRKGAYEANRKIKLWRCVAGYGYEEIPNEIVSFSSQKQKR